MYVYIYVCIFERCSLIDVEKKKEQRQHKSVRRVLSVRPLSTIRRLSARCPPSVRRQSVASPPPAFHPPSVRCPSAICPHRPSHKMHFGVWGCLLHAVSARAFW